MKIGFVMVNYNDSINTIKMIEQIKFYKIIDTIVVVDNASTDDSYQKLKKLENKHIVILKNDKNGGYGYGINKGIHYLNEQYEKGIAIVSNTDIKIEKEEDIKVLISHMDSETSVIAPIVREHQGYNRGWKVPTPWQEVLLGISFIHNWIRPKIILYSEQYYQNEIVEIEAVSGCFFLIKSRDLESIKYFDENIFLYYEENTLARKLQKMNKKTKLLTTVEVFHNHSVTINKNNGYSKKYDYLKESQLYFQKNYNHASTFNLIIMKIVIKFSKLGTHVKHWIKG